MRKGITEQIEAVIDQVAQMETLKPYILCGGTALAMQIDHRKSEDLDFMMWRTSKSEKPEVDWPKIQQELKEKVGAVERFTMLGVDQVEFVVRGVKFSFYVSDRFCPVANPIPYQGTIRLADVDSILAMNMEVMLHRAKFRDYYDIYAMLKEGADIKKGIDLALKYSNHKLTTKNLVVTLLAGGQFISDDQFDQLAPKYRVSKEQIREYILTHLQNAQLT